MPTMEGALVMASEFESQGEYIRRDSMPLTELQLNVMEQMMNAENAGMRRRARCESLMHCLETDLLRTAEMKDGKDSGFYQQYWEPCIDWFNKKFHTHIKVFYAEIEKLDPEQELKIVEEWMEKSPEDLWKTFYAEHRKDPFHTGQYDHQMIEMQEQSKSERLARFLNKRTDLELFLLEEVLRWTQSTILGLCLLYDGCSLSHAINAINCDELDTAMIASDLHTENLKLVESQMMIAACKNLHDLHRLDEDTIYWEEWMYWRDRVKGPQPKIPAYRMLGHRTHAELAEGEDETRDREKEALVG